jgi:guanine deaminase
MPDAAPHLVVTGTVLQTPDPFALEVQPDVTIEVDRNGTITAVHPSGAPAGRSAAAAATQVVRLSPTQRLLPGLIDTHVHAPQWPQLGTGLDLPLEQWLVDHTFPLEARYVDGAFAQRVWDDMVPSLLAHGTTTAVYFASIHDEATQRLAATCIAHGQRAFVGRVAMDHPEGTPSWYRDASAASAVEASLRSIEAIHALGAPGGLVQPIITPRFVPACTDALLAALGDLAASTGVLVQTHCSESDWEHRYVLDRYGHTDAEALDRFGLLRARTVLAHGNHVADRDLDRIRAAAAGVAHCPLSNSYFANAVFPVARALGRGVKVGLGTDVAGGGHPGLLPQCAHAVTVSRMLEDGVDVSKVAADRGVPDSRITAVAAFHLATVGGADLLGIASGLLAPGRAFDAVVVDVGRRASSLRVWDEVDDEAREDRAPRRCGRHHVGVGRRPTRRRPRRRRLTGAPRRAVVAGGYATGA